MKFYKQMDHKDCGSTCIRMIAKHYGRSVSSEKIRRLSETTRSGSTLKNIAIAAENLGFRSLGIRVDFNKLEEEVPLPCIIHWRQNHFVVVYKIQKGIVYVADPAHGLIEYPVEEFLQNWIGKGAKRDDREGIALILEPTPKLNRTEIDDEIDPRSGFKFLFQYLSPYKKFLIQLSLGLLTGSILQLFFPFLTQSVVDIGIQNQDINFVYLILIAQLFLFIGRTSVELIRGWILLHLSSRINISLVSDFFIKLMRLPISFFDTKVIGDLLQRINDHQRIERLLTNSTLNVLFSLFNLVIFGGVLAWYSGSIFLIFLGGSILYFGWIILFLQRRKDLDYKKFNQLSSEQSKVLELIYGMQEIKLNNAEMQKRWSWEYLQARLFKVELKSLTLEQVQTTGSKFINELKNIIISIFSAKLVIDGQLTLGMMMSVTYIIGQMNTPIIDLINFVYSLQDAKISLERLTEIHSREDEEVAGDDKLFELEENQSIFVDNLSFRYPGTSEMVLDKISMEISANKVTAIVGASGSGKSTLMKLLLKFYEPEKGTIKYGNINIEGIAQKTWREYCGTVLQEGYIFNDSIANNIAIGENYIDKQRLFKAVELANIKEFIENLPNSYNTKIGNEGIGISGGQKQRILIARAIYKNPKCIFFDEATSSLDAKNESIIVKNLDTFFTDRTAVVIAHRLSTVKNADQIVVLDKGKIIEKGSHNELIKAKGTYFNLVKNQLEMDKMGNDELG